MSKLLTSHLFETSKIQSPLSILKTIDTLHKFTYRGQPGTDK